MSVVGAFACEVSIVVKSSKVVACGGNNKQYLYGFYLQVLTPMPSHQNVSKWQITLSTISTKK